MNPIFPIRTGLGGLIREPNQRIPFALAVDGMREVLAFRGIIQQMRLTNQSKAQFVSSLGGTGYVYAFGEEFGDLILTGVAFSGDCKDPNNPMQESGFEAVYKYYNDRKASNSALPVTIVLGKNVTLLGFLVSFETNSNSYDSGFFQFNLVFKFLPGKKP